MATHSSILAWRIPGTGEPGGLPSMGSHSWRWLKRLSSSSSSSSSKLKNKLIGASWWRSGKESTCQWKRCRFHPWFGFFVCLFLFFCLFFFSSLIWEDPTCHRTTKPVGHKYWACTVQLLKPEHPRACALQEKPAQWDVYTTQLEGSPRLPQREKSLCNNKDPAQPKLNK